MNKIHMKNLENENNYLQFSHPLPPNKIIMGFNTVSNLFIYF